MRRWTLFLTVAGAITVFPFCVAGQSGRVTSTECCVELLLPVGARAVALGQSLTARSGLDVLFFNPAGIAGTNADQFMLHHETTWLGQNNAFSLLFDAGVAGAFGLTYILLDQGEEDERDPFGQKTGTLAIRTQQLIASYATGLSNSLSAGLSYKLFNAGQFCSGSCVGESSGTTHMLDLGLQYRPHFVPFLELGASVTHFGFALQQINAEQADPTPARIRFGAAYEAAHHFRPDSSVTVWLSGDVVNRLSSPGTPIAGVGVEVGFDQAIFVRAGFSGSGDNLSLGGGAIGIGIRYERYTIAIAKLFPRSELETEGDSFQVSFGIKF